MPSPPIADQPFDAQLCQPRRDEIEVVFLVRVDVVARRADQRAALGRIEFGNFLKERVQMHVRHARIEQAIEALDQAVDFDLAAGWRARPRREWWR